jgi:hypothetical protein
MVIIGMELKDNQIIINIKIDMDYFIQMLKAIKLKSDSQNFNPKIYFIKLFEV